MEEIYCISEAFSMQPHDFTVGRNVNNRANAKIAKIIRQTFHIAGEPHEYYVGYNEKQEKLFQYRVDSCNVQFTINSKPETSDKITNFQEPYK